MFSLTGDTEMSFTDAEATSTDAMSTSSDSEATVDGHRTGPGEAQNHNLF